MRFVACTLASTETGEGRTLILNLSSVVSMIRKDDVTHIDTGDEGVWRVKESPADLFRQEDAMVLCVSNQGTEFQQVIKEARARIAEQLAEEDRVGRIRLLRERAEWDRLEREKLEKANDKLLAEKLDLFAESHFNGHMGAALLSLLATDMSKAERGKQIANLIFELVGGAVEEFGDDMKRNIIRKITG